MTKNIYSAAIFFTGLFVLVLLISNIVAVQLGDQLLELSSLATWTNLQFLLMFFMAMIYLKYWHFRKYWLTFWLEVVSLLGSVFLLFMLRNFFATYEFAKYYYQTSLVMTGVGVLYGISLIFSGAGRRPWLKAAGILLILTGLGRMFSHFLVISSPNLQWMMVAGDIEKWMSWVMILVPVLFIFNFLDERKTAVEGNTLGQMYWVGAMNAVGFVAFISTAIIGIRVLSESTWISKNPNFVHENLDELVKPFEARIYVNKQGDTLRYRLMTPLNYEATKDYPLVACLHGSSGRGTDNAKQIAGSLTPHLLSKPENREKYPAFLFVPQCPPGTWWGGISGQSQVDSLIIESILALEKEFAIDENRRYVTGGSMGGYGAWHLIGTRPDFFAAAVPICGEGNPELAPNMVNVPVWAFHGAKDGNVPVSGSRNMIAAIKKAGGSPKYTEYPDEAHNLSQQIMNTPELLDWLFSQERNIRKEKL